jgi:hypothetical protein
MKTDNDRIRSDIDYYIAIKQLARVDVAMRIIENVREAREEIGDPAANRAATAYSALARCRELILARIGEFEGRKKAKRKGVKAST